MNKIAALTFLICLIAAPFSIYAQDAPRRSKTPARTSDSLKDISRLEKLQTDRLSTAKVPPIGNNLVYVLKVPVEIRSLHQDVKSFGVLCTMSPGRYIPYNPQLDNMDWVWSFDVQAGGDLSGEGYAEVPVNPSTPSYNGTVSVTVEASNSKPTPKFYRCVLHLADSSHDGHHNTMRWNAKDSARFPPRTAAPNTTYRPLAEGVLP